MLHNKLISIIGAGHLGRAFIAGLIKSGQPPCSIKISNSTIENTLRLASTLNVLGARTHVDAVETADIVILAVKPQLMKTVCQDIALVVQKKRPLVISLAGVVDIEHISLWLGATDLGIVRVMTNTPMAYGKGVSALFANPHMGSEQLHISTLLFNAVGTSFWVDKEPMLDALTAAVGCAPAYVFLFMEALQKAAISRGIPEALAAKIALDIVGGSVELAKHSDHSFQHLRDGVTTPNGVTAHSLKGLSEHAFFGSFKEVYRAADERIAQIKEAFPRSKL